MTTPFFGIENQTISCRQCITCHHSVNLTSLFGNNNRKTRHHNFVFMPEFAEDLVGARSGEHGRPRLGDKLRTETIGSEMDVVFGVCAKELLKPN